LPRLGDGLLARRRHRGKRLIGRRRRRVLARLVRGRGRREAFALRAPAFALQAIALALLRRAFVRGL
jgi:hypothetical protein